MAIETLSDDVLLENFDLCLDKDKDIDPWYAWGNEGSRRYSIRMMRGMCQRTCARDGDTSFELDYVSRPSR